MAPDLLAVTALLLLLLLLRVVMMGIVKGVRGVVGGDVIANAATDGDASSDTPLQVLSAGRPGVVLAVNPSNAFVSTVVALPHAQVALSVALVAVAERPPAGVKSGRVGKVRDLATIIKTQKGFSIGYGQSAGVLGPLSFRAALASRPGELAVGA